MSKLKLTPNAIRVLEKRYLKRDETGRVVETPEEMFRRVARHIASADLLYDSQADAKKTEEEFYRMMTSLDFLPNSPTLMNAGRELGQLSACFVLPIEDSMESIFEAVKNTAMIHKSGGGTGFSFSKIRPKNDIVQSTKGISSGPISFMTVFDAATEAIKQGGTRRGANMAILNVDHPDILDFITSKKDQTKLNNFNISVGITREFMKALEKDEEYDLVNPRTGKPVGKLKAREVFDLIAEMAWRNGDPGIVFLDRLNEGNPTPHVGRIESTNPCGEQPLLPYESCNLGSINLSHMVTNGKVNYDKLKEIVHKAVHFLDNVIDVNKYPLPEIERMTKANRKIGLGVMGFADMLIKLGIPYDSEEAVALAEEVMSFISKEAMEKSKELALKRGEFPNFKGSIYDVPGGPKVRNASRTTIAPTGSLSIIAGCSMGIEPLFALCFVRHVMGNEELLEVHPLFEEVARREGFYSKELLEKVVERGSLAGIKGVPKKFRRLFVTAHDIDPEWHVRMQAAFQKYTDNAVSKTVNLRREATVEDVKKVYLLADKLGCKGVTIYRDSSREEQVLTKGRTEPKKSPTVTTMRDRPRALQGRTIRMETGCGALYVTINEDEKGLFELFNTMGKAGGCAASQSEAIGRLVSLAWRSGIPPEEVIKQLIGIRCHKPHGIGPNKTLSCADAIAKAIKMYLEGDYTKLSAKERVYPTGDLESSFNRGACPECGAPLEYEEGCSICRSCGYSDCE